MYNDVEEKAYAETKSSSEPESMRAVSKLHALLEELEHKLSPVLKISQNIKEAKPEELKSSLMSELGYLQNRIKDILERLHV